MVIFFGLRGAIKMRSFSIFLFVALMVMTSGVSAQTPGKPNPAYDAELAKKLGGTDSGMRTYVLALLKTGPNDAAVTDKDQRAKLFAGHMANINKLADEGKLAVAGPFGDPERKYRGLFILAVSKVEEARVLAETDPAIKAGIFVVEYIPWYGSASLMATPEIHKKISKTIE